MSQAKQTNNGCTVPNKACVDSDLFVKNASNNNPRNQSLKSSSSLKKSFMNNSILPNYGYIFEILSLILTFLNYKLKILNYS